MTAKLCRQSKSENRDRCIKLAEYIISENATVREAARKFGVSKSTVHKDVTEKLARTDKEMYKKVQGVLLKNKAERHLRGGLATKRKYLKLSGK